MRSAPNAECVAAALSRIATGADASISRKYSVELVTPMYGGGVEAGKTDLAMPIRAASIRGQLRFWWRILFARGLSPPATFERETAIWGGIGAERPSASRVRLRVVCEPVTEARLQGAPKKPGEDHAYAFGAAISKKDAAGKFEDQYFLKAKYRFDLYLRYPSEVAGEVEETLRWWARFGGVGARTRRGFGAVRVDGLSAQPIQDAKRAAERMGGKLVVARKPYNVAEEAWEAAANKLRGFRQLPVGRRGTWKEPGRSRWPEPDQLRRFASPDDDTAFDHTPVHLAGDVFPRAVFGLPINFEFKGGKKGTEPPTQQLLPDGDADRMASPLILRPFCVDRQQWYAAALLLPPHWKQALTQDLRFKESDDVPARWPDDERQRAHLAGLIEPMKKADGTLRGTDPLSAFLQYFAE